MLKFGLVEGGVRGVMSCLHDVLGPDATILMPAFTFSFGESRVWDYNNSKSEVGALSEYFRKQEGTERTIHPFHSLSVSGKESEQFLSCKNLSSFGDGSPYDLLYESEAINIGLVTEFIGGATFLHHTEEIAQVPYRSYKDFEGDVFDRNGKKLCNTYKMYAREISRSHVYDNEWDKVWSHFVSEKLVIRENLNGANLFAFDIKSTHDNFLKALRDNPYYCAKKHMLSEDS